MCFELLGFFLKADKNNAEDQPPAKRRLSGIMWNIYTYLLGIYYVKFFILKMENCWNFLKIESLLLSGMEGGAGWRDRWGFCHGRGCKERANGWGWKCWACYRDSGWWKAFKLQQSGWSRRDFDLRAVKRVNFNSCLVSECVLCALIL